MKWNYFIVTALALFSFSSVKAQEGPLVHSVLDKWEEMISYDGRFRLMSPGKMESKHDTMKTAIGELVYHTFYFQTDEKSEENYVYMLSYCDYPPYTIHSDSSDLLLDFFETTVETAVSSVRGELMYSTDTDLNDYPGKLWRIDYLNGRAIIKTKALVVKSRYYAVQTVTKKGMGVNQSADVFLDSFRLLE